MIYFTSDLHVGHRNIIEFCNRPWDSVEEMNEGLVENWNRVVGKNDLVYVLGDVAMGKIEDSLQVLTRLNGTKRLVAGNHDRCWEGNGNKHKAWIPRYAEVGFPPTKERHFLYGGKYFVLDHFPYTGDSHAKERYLEYRPVDRGSWLLHGHVHDSWVRDGRQINVGVDVWNYEPVSADALLALHDYYTKEEQ